jgi:hypothetical protein
MKSFKLLLLCFICIGKTYGYVTNNYGHIVVEIIKKGGKIFSQVDVTGFGEADSSWVQSLKKNINESIQAGKRIKKGKYIVSVKFIIAKDGNLSDIVCESNPGFGMCEKVVHIVKKSRKWKPAEPVKVREFQ